ncbi:unnamed protein product [Gongylonema pulchrum]|uniref:Uncharacterized protein n=1 Tax=Gongylonema pulchrum TaxID=637853 RepID=A0A3P7RLZ0_9BILA|nr:unnamed protein product [Gongylonema pulchrum]
MCGANHNSHQHHHENYSPLFVETTRGRNQSDSGSGHHVLAIDPEKCCAPEANGGTFKETSDISQRPRSAAGTPKRVTLSPDVEIREYQPANYSDDSDDEDSSPKYQQQSGSDRLGFRNFRDVFPSERRHARSLQRTSKISHDFQLLVQGDSNDLRETPILAKDDSSLNLDYEESCKNLEMQEKPKPPLHQCKNEPKIQQTKMEKSRKKPDFLEHKNLQHRYEERRGTALLESLREMESKKGQLGVSSELFREKSSTNNENVVSSSQSIRYPCPAAPERKNKGEPFINSMASTELEELNSDLNEK